MTTDRMLVTRPIAQGRLFADECRRRFGASMDITVAPVLRIEPVGKVPSLEGVRGLIFTSINGVAAFAAASARRDLRAWCVGPATAQAAADAGFAAVAAEGDAVSLIALLARERPQGPLLHLRGRHARGGVAEKLTAQGIATRAAVIYDQIEQSLPLPGREALARPDPLLVPVFSPRSARLLVPWLAGAAAELHVASISPAVSAEFAGQLPTAIETAVRPDAEAVLAALDRLRERRVA